MDGGQVRVDSARSKINRAVGRVVPARFSEPNPDYTVERLLKLLSAKLFFSLDRVGVHLLPKHFYTPVADYSWLRNNRNLWSGPANLQGMHWDLEEQLTWLQTICDPYYSEVRDLASFTDISSSGIGPGYGPIESQVLHCFIRSKRPRQVIEIGSGVSTMVMRGAAQLNERDGFDSTRIFAIEPYPRTALRHADGIELINSLVQEAPLSFFDQLDSGDLLFVDSSHAVKIGSDALRICLEIIPRLKPGVFIQIHDISLPYLYPRNALSDYFGWQESAMVLALLTNNSRLSPLCCMSALHYERPTELASITTAYRPQANDEGLAPSGTSDGHCPDSLWLTTA
jgi:hypothetical protein